MLNKDMTIFAVDIANKTTITFKNGSVIECLPIKNNSTIRGRRSELPIHYDNFEFNQEEFDEVIKDYLNKK